MINNVQISESTDNSYVKESVTCQMFGQGEYHKAFKKPDAIYLGVDHIDGRKGLNGLIAYTQLHLEKDPTAGDLYVFCSKNRTKLKMLYFCEGVYWLIQSYKTNGKFAWPNSEEAARKLTVSQLYMMIDGIDCFKNGTLIKLAN